MSERRPADLHDVPNPAPVTRPPFPAPGRPAPAATVLAPGQAMEPLFVRPRSGPGHPRFRAAGAGAPVSGALGASLLAASALLLAPGEARAIEECGRASLGATVTCSGASYSDGIFYGGSDTARWLLGNNRVNVPGSGASTTWIGAGASQAVGFYGRMARGNWVELNIGGETDGTAHVVNVVQGTNSNTDADRNNGVYLWNQKQLSATTVNLKRGVTIGSAAAPMKQNGLWVRLDGDGYFNGRGTDQATITSAATIFAAKRGIRIGKNISNTAAATTLTNSGDISSGEEGIYLYYAPVTPPYVNAPLSLLRTYTGGATITNTGAITVSGAKYGIVMDYQGRGAIEIDNAGDITAATGSGIRLAANGDLVGDATLTNSGAVSAATLGLRLEKRNGSGAMTLTNRGAVTVTADAAAGVGHAIWLTEGATGSGAFTITNSGDLRSKNHALYAVMGASNTDDLELTNSAAVTSEDGDGIRLERGAAGDVTVSNSGTVTGGTYGIYAAGNGAIEVTVAAGATVTGGTAGVYVANAGTGLMVARKYTYGFGMNDGATADDPVAVMHGEGADAVALRNQLVEVAGTVTGGTDAAIRLSGGGGVIVMEGGKVHAAGASGVGILADGPALVYVDGEVKGGAGGAAAVHLSGGGIVTVGPNGRVQANGAGHAIRGGATDETMVALTLVTERLVPYREDVIAQVEGSIAGVENARLREYRDGVPTGYSQELRITADGLLDTSKFPSRPEEQFDCTAADGRCRITQGETITGRTGVYAAVPRASASGETRAAADQPLIGVTWTGTFSHGEGFSDEGRFEAASARDVLSFDRESAAGKAVEETVRWDAPAGIEAHALSWRDVAAEVAKGDDPGEIADAAAQTALVPAGATASDNDYVAQFKAALGNEEIEVAPTVITAIGSTATTAAELTDDEIVTYLDTDDAVTRALLRNVLAQGLSDKEKAVLRAVAAGDDAGLTAALDDADAGFSNAYKTAVRALLERYNVGDIHVAVNEGSITAARGDGIRAWYATPHDKNGGISVTVAAGTTVTGGEAGVYVANAGEDLRIPKRYAPEAIRDLAGNANAGEDDLIAIGGLNAAGDAIETPYLDQLVTVAGTVTGGTDAAVHLSGGGAVIVMKGGKVHAGASGIAIKVNDPGPVHLFIDGEVRGRVPGEGEAPAPAAVDLPGGGSVIVGLNGKVEAAGAARAIRDGGADETRVKVVLAIASQNREDVEAAHERVEGSYPQEGETYSEYRDGVDGVPVPMGYTGEVKRNPDGTPDLSGFEPRPYPEGQERGADGEYVSVSVPVPPDGSRTPRMTLECAAAGDRRCRLYEALPSVLVAMNTLPSYAERTSAARDGNGGWAQVEASRGEWQAKTAKTTGKLAYDHRRVVGRAGIDFLAGESARVGVSVHALGGKAEMREVGEVELDGMGGGLSATWLVGEFYVDAQAAVTWYDVDVESDVFGKMPKKDVHGAGYGLGVDVGRRMSVGGMMVTPRAGVEWSKVALEDFMDMERAGGSRARVSVEEAGSVKGRLGMMVEAEMGSGESSGRLFASLDVEQEFSAETEVEVGGQMLKTEVRPTAVRVGLGGEFAVAEDVVVRATAGYRTSGSGTSGYGGGLELQVRF